MSDMSLIEWIAVVVIAVLVLLAVGGLVTSYRHDKLCETEHHRGHYRTVHHEATTTFIMIDKVMVPQFQSAYDERRWVCEEEERHRRGGGGR